MGIHTIKLPDVGEGVAEAEFVELHVAVGDAVTPDQNLADVMTDKATVEIPSPRAGVVVWIGAEVGETVAVGSEIIRIEIEGAGNTSEGDAPAGADAGTDAGTGADAAPAPAMAPDGTDEAAAAAREEPAGAVRTPNPAPEASVGQVAARAQHADTPRARPEGDKPLASPAVRRRAQDRGVDLMAVMGSGPAGRVTHEDLNAYLDGSAPAAGAGRTGSGPLQPDPSITEVKVVGLRRKIAEKMSEAKRRIPHITYVEEVDVTALEDLRAHMNAQNKGTDKPKLTVLPYLIRAVVLACRQYPHVNARYDDEGGVVRQHGGVHLGVATQTENGLIVPVIRHAEALDLYAAASEVVRLSGAARDGTARRDELSGSTITITSLGPLGGIVTTPVINHPEVAIVGVNKIQTLPRYDAGGNLVPRKLMNLSSGFDHRIVDGWDAAEFVQAIKGYLEHPATMFV